MHPRSSSASSISVSTSICFSTIETIRHIVRIVCHRLHERTSIYSYVKNGCSEYIRGDHMKLADKVILVTGANRGIGQALVEEALRRGAKRVYATTRQPLAHSDVRVTPLTLDVTNAAQIQAAVERVG